MGSGRSCVLPRWVGVTAGLSGVHIAPSWHTSAGPLCKGIGGSLFMFILGELDGRPASLRFGRLPAFSPPPHPRLREDGHLETTGGKTVVPGLLIAPRSGWVCRPVLA